MMDGISYVRKIMIENCSVEYESNINNFFDDYFIITYTKRYSLPEWNFHNDFDRTQNLIEVFHKNWKSKLGTHPSIYKWINNIQKLDALSFIKIIQLSINKKFKKKKPEQRECEKLINKLNIYLNNDLIDIAIYLKCCSLAIKLKADAGGIILNDYINNSYNIPLLENIN